MSKLPQETIDEIKKQAEAKWVTKAEQVAHNAAATEWAGRAEEHLIPALEWIKTYGPCDALTVNFIDNALAKYKEVSNG